MAIIVDNLTGNKAVQLGNEEFVRPMAIGNNWQKIRIALRLMINSSAALVDVRIMIGVCSGAVDTFSSSNCVGWIGSQWPANYLTFAPTYSGGGYYFYSSGAATCFTAVKKVGNTETGISASSGLQHAVASISSSKVSIMSVDIIRSTTDATSYAVKPNQCTASMAIAGPDRYAFLRTIEDEPLGSSFALAYQQLQGSSTGYSHTGLPTVMDTVSILWNKSVPTIDICDLTVLRFY